MKLRMSIQLRSYLVRYVHGLGQKNVPVLAEAIEYWAGSPSINSEALHEVDIAYADILLRYALGGGDDRPAGDTLLTRAYNFLCRSKPVIVMANYIAATHGYQFLPAFIPYLRRINDEGYITNLSVDFREISNVTKEGDRIDFQYKGQAYYLGERSFILHLKRVDKVITRHWYSPDLVEFW